MCLAIPAKIISVDGTTAHCEMSGVTKDVDISLTPQAKAGDWVIVHVGFALNRIDEKEAEETLALLRSTGLASDDASAKRAAAGAASSGAAS